MVETVTSVPLPRRIKLDTSNRVALTIRDGRRVANELAALIDPSKTSLSSRETFSGISKTGTSLSTVLEQDFTIEGKKGKLQCPFSAAATPATADADDTGEQRATEESSQDPTPHQSSDPICAAMYEESMSKPAQDAGATAPTKCPIRFLDKHSPEEIARYVETHKHKLPRSHEVCLRRNQRNEDQIRKLDAKYGDIVGMIQDLSNLHKRMLPTSEEQREIDKASNERVENWAKAVTASTPDGQEPADDHPQAEPADADREGHFDRPFKEVRVGESPSRPWGISVPVYESHGLEEDQGPPPSPPPAPVVMPASSQGHPTPMKSTGGKCPFDHTRFSGLGDATTDGAVRPETPAKDQAPPPIPPQPTFINPPPAPGPLPQIKQVGATTPQMIFTGPVFIGYPAEQAIQIMQHYQGRQ